MPLKSCFSVYPNVEFVLCFTHGQNATYLRKARCCDIFGNKLRMGDDILIFLNKLSIFVLNYKLTSVSWTEKVILCVNSWKSYPSPKIFYTSAIHDKFNVCAYPELWLHETHSLPYLLPEQAIKSCSFFWTYTGLEAWIAQFKQSRQLQGCPK